jgi:Na+/H+-dicarboxylate symporter
MFQKMPFVLVVMIAVLIFIDSFLPLAVKQTLYALSLVIKEGIIFVLPGVIFALLFKAAVLLSKGATRTIALILALVCCSNFLSTFASHFVGQWIYTFDLTMLAPHESQGLEPLWRLSLTKLISNDKALFGGIFLGLGAARFWPEKATIFAQAIDKGVVRALEKFSYLIPLFVAGFVVKMAHDGILMTIFKDYTAIFVCICGAQFGYILVSYFLLTNAQPKAFVTAVKNMLPAMMSGFSTMSSAATMPLTLLGTEKNTTHKDLSRSVIPATVNIHLVGDCFAIPIFAYAVMKSFGVAEPSLITYLSFTLYFVIAKFSVAAIPGGGIVVMLPILESTLGFNAPMMSLITALYILFDPVITSANVLGNGAFALGMDRLLGKKA